MEREKDSTNKDCLFVCLLVYVCATLPQCCHYRHRPRDLQDNSKVSYQFHRAGTLIYTRALCVARHVINVWHVLLRAICELKFVVAELIHSSLPRRC